MTTWNYRVIRTENPLTGNTTYQIHEVYYREDGTIDCWTQEPVEPLGVSDSQLRNDIHAFLAAFRQPTLEEHQQRGKSVLIEERLSPSTDLQRDFFSRISRASGYLYQILGNHELLKMQPELRQAYDHFEQALLALHELIAPKPLASSSAPSKTDPNKNGDLSRHKATVKSSD